MSPSRPHHPNKPLVWLAAVCVGMDWFLLATFTLFFVLVRGAVMFGLLPMHISVSRLPAHVFLACVACFVLFGFVYLVAALSLTGPHCGFKFLKNPKGMGPAGFVYHQDCPKRTGRSPWAIQIGRFLASGKIRCVTAAEKSSPSTSFLSKPLREHFIDQAGFPIGIKLCITSLGFAVLLQRVRAPVRLRTIQIGKPILLR
jgi:hypothetical protein